MKKTHNTVSGGLLDVDGASNNIIRNQATLEGFKESE